MKQLPPPVGGRPARLLFFHKCEMETVMDDFLACEQRVPEVTLLAVGCATMIVLLAMLYSPSCGVVAAVVIAMCAAKMEDLKNNRREQEAALLVDGGEDGGV